MEQQPAQTQSASPANPHPSPRGANRCRHRSRANGRCRLPVQDPATGLCFVHNRVRKTTYAFDDTRDLSADLFGQSAPSFDSPEQINQTLINLVVLVAQGRLSPRRAAVISHALSILLRGLHASHQRVAETSVPYLLDIDSAVARLASANALATAQEHAQPPTHIATLHSPANHVNTQPPPTHSAADPRHNSNSPANSLTNETANAPSTSTNLATGNSKGPIHRALAPRPTTQSTTNPLAPEPRDPYEALDRYSQLRT